MLTESQNHEIMDMLKTVYPTKTKFCEGYKEENNKNVKWSIAWQNKQNDLCAQLGLRSDCIRCELNGKLRT